jgi:hypothetical protein
VADTNFQVPTSAPLACAIPLAGNAMKIKAAAIIQFVIDSSRQRNTVTASKLIFA